MAKRAHVGPLAFTLVAPSKGAPPFDPHVFIDPIDRSYRGPAWDLRTESEIDYRLERLGAEGDPIGDQAKQALRQARAQRVS